MNVCVVLPPIANYPCIIAFCRNNSNVDMCPDPSFSREGSGSETTQDQHKARVVSGIRELRSNVWWYPWFV